MRELKEFTKMTGQGEVKHLADIEGQKIVIYDVGFREGLYGEYAVLYAKNGNGEDIVIPTGASIIMDAIRRVAATNEFPVTAVFRRIGRLWIIE